MDDTQHKNTTSSSTTSLVPDDDFFVPSGSASPIQDEPSAPASGPREMEPRPSAQPSSEVLTPSEKPVEVEPEVENVGVQPTPVMQNIQAEAKDVGLQEAKEATPVATQPQGIVELPLAQDRARAENIVKNKFKAGDALTWLAMIIVRHFQMEDAEKKEGK